MSTNDIMDLEDQRRLELTLKTRERIITSLTDGGRLPSNTEDREFLMKALDGMDRTVLTKAKIKVDDSASKNQASTVKMISEALTRINTRKVTAPTREGEPELTGVEAPQLVEGENHIGTQTFKYDEIMGNDK